MESGCLAESVEGTAGLDPTTPVQFLPGVGPIRAQRLARLGIATVEDLLWHVPRAHADRSEVVPAAKLVSGIVQTTVGTVVQTRSRRTGRGFAIFEADLKTDDASRLTAVWFNQPYLASTIRAGRRLLLNGKVESDRMRHVRMQSPEYELLDEGVSNAGTAGGKVEPRPAERQPRTTTRTSPVSVTRAKRDAIPTGERPLHGGRIVPLYPLTAGVSQKQVRQWIQSALVQLGPSLVDPLPSAWASRLRLPGLLQAFERVHFPESADDVERARTRLAFDEFLAAQLAFGLVKRTHAEAGFATPLVGTGELETAFRSRLPFALTQGQESVLAEIRSDLMGDRAMNRLLQGDVGSGKTVVAALAAVIAIESGAQVAYMAPTEILAQQQGEAFQRWLLPLGRRARALLGRTRTSERREILAELSQGWLDVLVGTHALLEDWVSFRRLGLVVVDEQHRFGVVQRGRLRGKSSLPHCLVMSATPIPRTLSLTLYGDLDLSLLTEMPPGREPPRTHLVPPTKRDQMLGFVADLCRRGERVFFIYPLVQESEQIDLRDATNMAEELRAHHDFQGVRVGLLHGRMKGEEKDAAIERFRDGSTPCLVSTTVVEVGVNIPEATAMVVEHPERFGLSQLHQLRGRVGRGGGTSHFLMAAPGSLSREARARLEVLVRESNGFRVAEADLETRGPGDMLGTAQHGLPRFRVGDLIRDPELLVRAREVAQEILTKDPDLSGSDNRGLRALVKRRHGQGMSLFQVG